MKLFFKGCLASLLLTSASIANAQPPEISSARIIQPPPGAKVAAAYFTILNTSSEPLLITGVSSEAIPQVSIHLSAVVNDVAKMIPQESVSIAAGESLEFKHGSYHIMLMGLSAPLSPGSMIAFEIETSAGVLPIMIPIMTADEASSMTSHSMNHDAMNGDTKEGSDTQPDGSMVHENMDASKSMDKN